MEIRVNGEVKTLESPLTVQGMLEALGINPKAVAVERNLSIVARADFDKEPVRDGDTIEIIRLVGGG